MLPARSQCRKDGSAHNTAQLLSGITLGNANGTSLHLSSVEYFIGSESLKTRIPLDGPLPASLMSLNITTGFNPTVTYPYYLVTLTGQWHLSQYISFS